MPGRWWRSGATVGWCTGFVALTEVRAVPVEWQVVRFDEAAHLVTWVVGRVGGGPVASGDGRGCRGRRG
jgi:hypothetical protein